MDGLKEAVVSTREVGKDESESGDGSESSVKRARTLGVVRYVDRWVIMEPSGT
jgi:hypothetical protein